MQQETHRRQLKVHPAILHSVIGAQCGTLGKAILEAVMNSHDAHASECRVTLGREGFEVHDDGRGFASQKEIDDWFETFGTPHQEGDAEFGRFRVGRGQLLNFGINEWRTGRFQMTLDYRKEGFDYELTTGLRQVKGCRIKVTLYSPLSQEDHLKVEEELRRLVRYAPIAVRLNGKLISRDPSKLKWDLVTPEAYINVDRNKELEVYNKGVYVRSYDAAEYGTGGEVVSRSNLEVNFARNDVQRYTCKVWPLIEDQLRTHAFALVQGKRNLNRGERKFLSRQIGYNETPKNKALAADLPLIPDIQGQVHTIREVLGASRISIGGSKKSRIANKVHEDGLALVLSADVLEQFGLHRYSDETDLEVLDRLLYTFRRASDLPFHGEVSAVGDLAQHLRSDYRTFAPGDLSLEQQVFLDVLEAHHDAFLRVFPKHERPAKRALCLGASVLARAWTDGRTYITFTTSEAERVHLGGVGDMLGLLTLLVHEYGHDDSDLDDHLHDLHFYEKYHDLTVHRMPQLAEVAQRVEKALRKQLTQNQKAGSLRKEPHSEEPSHKTRMHSAVS